MKAQLWTGVLVVTGMSACAAASAVEPSIRTGNRLTSVEGTIRQNVKDCERDGACYLVLASDSKSVRLYYHHGDGETCVNAKVGDVGLKAQPGAHVVATGTLTVSGSLYRI